MSRSDPPAAVGELNPGPGTAGFSYFEAFSRNRGLISPEEQDRLRRARVALLHRVCIPVAVQDRSSLGPQRL